MPKQTLALSRIPSSWRRIGLVFLVTVGSCITTNAQTASAQIQLPDDLKVDLERDAVLPPPRIKDETIKALKKRPTRIEVPYPADGDSTYSPARIKFSAVAKLGTNLTGVQYRILDPDGAEIESGLLCQSAQSCGTRQDFDQSINMGPVRNGVFKLAIQVSDEGGQIISTSRQFSVRQSAVVRPAPRPVRPAGYTLMPQSEIMSPHPRLAPLPSIHFDHYNSSVTDAPVPEFSRLRMVARDFDGGTARNGTCLNFMEDPRGNLIGFCGDRDEWYELRQAEYQITLFDKQSFNKLDRITIAEDIKLASHGCYDASEDKAPLYLGYFVMDNLGRALVTKDDNVTYFIRASDDGRSLETVDKIRFSDLTLPRMQPDFRLNEKLNRVAQIIPDYGSGYWFMGQGSEESAAFVGHITGDKRVDFFQWLNNNSQNEVIENGMAVDQSGLYVLSDHALYKFRQSGRRVEQVFRETYKRASEDSCKKGTMAHRGSGSTPTILGSDLIAFTDNADVRVNVVVMDRRDRPGHEGRRICEVPVFSPLRSANENSLIGYNNSLIVQNWYGAPNKITGDTRLMRPGVWRIDVSPDRTNCSIIWQNDDIGSTATARLSTKTGLIYMPIESWRAEQLQLAALDFDTGREAHPRLFLGNITLDEFPDDLPDDEQILMLPIYTLLNGELVQPVFAGVKRIIAE